MSDIRTCWQAMSDDNGGMTSEVPGPYFWYRDEACKHCHTWAGVPKPKERRVIVVDGKVFLLSDAIDVHESSNDLERSLALAKLTPSERKALGF